MKDVDKFINVLKDESLSIPVGQASRLSDNSAREASKFKVIGLVNPVRDSFSNGVNKEF